MLIKINLRALRELPNAVKVSLEQLPKTSAPYGCYANGLLDVLGCIETEDASKHMNPTKQGILVDRLMASFGSMLAYWYHFSHNDQTH